MLWVIHCLDGSDTAAARENVVLLKKLCPSGCEELADLEQAVASASPKASVVSPTNN